VKSWLKKIALLKIRKLPSQDPECQRTAADPFCTNQYGTPVQLQTLTFISILGLVLPSECTGATIMKAIIFYIKKPVQCLSLIFTFIRV
jgi:hypothetical protein